MKMKECDADTQWSSRCLICILAQSFLAIILQSREPVVLAIRIERLSVRRSEAYHVSIWLRLAAVVHPGMPSRYSLVTEISGFVMDSYKCAA